jgi:putative ribosome biogenesis GTPase RsgA
LAWLQSRMSGNQNLLYRTAVTVLFCSVILFIQVYPSTNTHLQQQQQQQVHAQEEKRKAIIGAWAPYQRPLEKIQDVGQQQEAMKSLLAKGFVEYYFVMTDFKNSLAKEMTEKLLTSADEIGLHILIILLPPSEGGPNTNYDWEG